MKATARRKKAGAPASRAALPPKGQKHDTRKPRFDLTPPDAWLAVARVLAHGAEKYGDDNWRQVPNARRRYLAAAYRHINAAQRGEAFDAESGLPHLAHAVACLLFALESPHA